MNTLKPSSIHLYLSLIFIALAHSMGLAQNIVGTANFSSPRSTEIDGQTRLSMEFCSDWRQLGQPILPFRLLRLLLPPNSAIDRIEIRLPQGESAVPLHSPVEYVHTPQSNGPRDQNQESLAATPDPAIYLSPLPFPASRAELISIQTMLGYDIALVRVFPLQYLPTASELKFAPEIQVELVLAAPAAPSLTKVVASHRLDDQRRIATWVDNPEILRPAQRLQNSSLLSQAGLIDYLIITRSNLASSFQPLATLKEQQGLKVKVETMESITSQFSGKDTPEKIRNFIKKAYVDWEVRYVLLGGDSTVVPCRYAYANMNRSEVESLIPCDLYYACLDGSWNRDGDNRWGEPTDGDDGREVDLLAEVWVGRAPVDTATEASIFVDKQVLYQTVGRENLHTVLVAAEFLDDFPQNIQAQGGDMFDPLLPFFRAYQVDWLDDRPGELPRWSRSEAIAALNLSPHLLLYNGHGDIDTIMRLELADLNALSNQWPFFVYSVGCNAGQFDNDKFSPDAIGEELIKRNRHGALAAILNSRLGWYDPAQEWKYSGEFQLKYFDELLSRGHTQVGIASQLSKHALIGQVESSGLMPYRWCYYEINLLGDPHLAWRLLPLTTQGTPEWWLRQQGWTNQFEQAATQDTDGDNLVTWQEYVAGTDPRNASSVLKVKIIRNEQDEATRLTWPSATNRLYSIWMTEDLGSAKFIPLATHLSATPPENSFIDPANTSQPRYYRIEAQ